MAWVEHLVPQAVSHPIPFPRGIEARVGVGAHVAEEIDRIGGIGGVAEIKVEVPVPVPVVEPGRQAAADVRVISEDQSRSRDLEKTVPKTSQDKYLAGLGGIDQIVLAVVLEVLHVNVQQRPGGALPVQKNAFPEAGRKSAGFRFLLKIPNEAVLAAAHQIRSSVAGDVLEAKGGAHVVVAHAGAVPQSPEFPALHIEKTFPGHAVPKVLPHFYGVFADDGRRQKFFLGPFGLFLLLGREEHWRGQQSKQNEKRKFLDRVCHFKPCHCFCNLISLISKNALVAVGVILKLTETAGCSLKLLTNSGV